MNTNNKGELKEHLSSIRNLTKMTQAIETVSVTKVRRAIDSLVALRPYAFKAWKVLIHLARQPAHGTVHPLLHEVNQVDRALLFLISGEQGLAGAFNQDIIRFCLDYFKSKDYDLEVFIIGERGYRLLNRWRPDLKITKLNTPNPLEYNRVTTLGQKVIDEYMNERVDKVFLGYTRFISKTRLNPEIREILPIETAHSDSLVEKYNITHPSEAIFTYEPNRIELLNQVTLRFISLQIYKSILESLASEHSARMITMHNATDNGQKMAKNLEMAYHKARQRGITAELIDIVNGSNLQQERRG